MVERMTREEAIRILDEVIPPPEHHTVDLDHLRIAQAWAYTRETLKADPIRHGHWIDAEPAPWGQMYETCSECGIRQTLDKGKDKFCGVCGAKMDGTNESVESVDLGNGFSISVNKSQVDAQGRYCSECLHSPTCYGAGISKPACKAFVPRVRYVDCKDDGENG